LRLAGKRTLVTGASKGIGAAIAKTFASEGADVAINYRASEKEAKAIADSIEAMGRRGITIQADVSKSSEVDRMFDIIKKEFGELDVMVSNAGVADGKIWKAPFDKITLDMWEKVFSVDVFGTFLCTQRTIPLMSKGGKIITIASTPVLTGDKEGLVYASAKASVFTLTKALAQLLAPKITVNCMMLGAIETSWIDWLTKKDIAKLKSSIPLRRFGSPQDVANLAVFLASNESSYITGQGIIIDGGEVMR
jgi:3-oxoacyl-[acyl-carrier protein] reductase